MGYKTLGIAVLAALLIGAYAGHHFTPVNTDKSTQTEVVKKDIITVIKEVEKKDGTKETVTTITDNSKETSKATETISIAPKSPDWHVSAGVDYNWTQPEAIYKLQVERRILGPIFLGASVNTKSTIGAVIGLEF